MLGNRWWDEFEASIQSGDVTIACRASHKVTLRVFANTPTINESQALTTTDPHNQDTFHLNPQQWYVSLIQAQ